MVKCSKDVVAAWAEETARYIIRTLDEQPSLVIGPPRYVADGISQRNAPILQGHASTCYSYWPYVQLEYESVHQKLLQETWLRYLSVYTLGKPRRTRMDEQFPDLLFQTKLRDAKGCRLSASMGLSEY